MRLGEAFHQALQAGKLMVKLMRPKFEGRHQIGFGSCLTVLV